MKNIDPWMIQPIESRLLRGRRKIEDMLDTAKVRRAELIARKDVLPDIAPVLDWLDRKISSIESLASFLQAELRDLRGK